MIDVTVQNVGHIVNNVLTLCYNWLTQEGFEPTLTPVKLGLHTTRPRGLIPFVFVIICKLLRIVLCIANEALLLLHDQTKLVVVFHVFFQ